MKRKSKIKIRGTNGFTLVEIMIVVAIIGILMSIAIPNLRNARTKAQMNACISNLRCIADAKDQWALEQRKQDGDTPQGSDLQPYLGRSAYGSLPSCPVDTAQTFATSYSAGSVATKPVCLIVASSHILP
jgi:general secretion pathway protein G